MSRSLAATITWAASKQTYYTIRLLVDRPRVEDAYRAYAYFRWVDDLLDAAAPADGATEDDARHARRAFLDRQQSLVERCLRGQLPGAVNRQEAMLVELLRPAGADNRIVSYVRHMMLVMEFDVGRRGRLATEAQLDEYTRCLAIAVSEAMHAFLDGGRAPSGVSSPRDDTRYRAVAGAHVLHMLRDTFDDLRTGYVNVPREVLEAHRITPRDVDSDAYRAWVAGRVRRAREDLDAGRAYFAGVPSIRHRIAGLAYMARFEWLIDTLERDGYRLRPRYTERGSPAAMLRMVGLVAAGMLGLRHHTHVPSPVRLGRGDGSR
jgi:phytoene/squalene synthetase